MSEMIKIPEGWESVELEKLLEYEQPTKYLVSTENYHDSYKTPVLTAGKTFILGYTNEENGIFNHELPVIIFDDFTTASKFVNFPFKAKSSAMKMLKTKDKTIDIKIVYELMQKLNFKPEEHKRHWISTYSKLKINLPKLEKEQQKIAEVLSEVDNAISKTEELFDKNKRLKTALMQDLLSCGIDENRKIRSPQTHKFKSSELGDIPEEWDVKNIGEIYKELRTGSTPSRANPEYFRGEILWITSGELKYKTITNTIEKITEQAVKDTNLKIYPSGTFFIAITGLEAEGTRGSCAVIGKEATTNQSCMAFEANEEIDTSYLFQYYLLHGKYISLYYSQGSKQQSLNNKIVAQIPIHIPPLQEQQKIAQILSSQDEKIEDIKNKLNKLKSLKASLMQDLLNGKVRVTKLMEENS